jgi:hypothetical protein
MIEESSCDFPVHISKATEDNVVSVLANFPVPRRIKATGPSVDQYKYHRAP